MSVSTISSTLVDPPAPPNPASKVLIFDTDSMTSTKLYLLGQGPSDPEFTVSTEEKCVVLRRGSGGPVLASVAYSGSMQKARGKFGTINILGKDEVKIEEWLTLKDLETGRGKRAAVDIHGREYLWAHIAVGEGTNMHMLFECTLDNHPVALFRSSRADSHWNELTTGAVGPRQKKITRAHVVLTNVEEKDELELMLSLIVSQQLIRSNSGTTGSQALFAMLATPAINCPMQ